MMLDNPRDYYPWRSGRTPSTEVPRLGRAFPFAWDLWPLEMPRTCVFAFEVVRVRNLELHFLSCWLRLEFRSLEGLLEAETPCDEACEPSSGRIWASGRMREVVAAAGNAEPPCWSLLPYVLVKSRVRLDG